MAQTRFSHRLAKLWSTRIIPKLPQRAGNQRSSKLALGEQRGATEPCRQQLEVTAPSLQRGTRSRQAHMSEHLSTSPGPMARGAYRSGRRPARPSLSRRAQRRGTPAFSAQGTQVRPTGSGG